MPTDEERREVAARLREERRRMDAEKPPSVPIIAAAEYLLRISRIVLRDEDGGRLFDRLADLIDRPTCKMRFDSVHEDFACTSCGHWFDSFQTFDGHGYWHDMRYCPSCGAEVVDGG